MKYMKRYLATNSKFPITAPDSIMNPRQHGTCLMAPLRNLRFSVDYNKAD